jgi:hypothetical protein
MANHDRITPPDPHRAARVPRPEPRAAADDQRAARERASAEAKRGAIPPPLPHREQERKQTPASGGIEAQPRPTASVVVVEPKGGTEEAPRSKAPTASDWAKLRFKLASAAVGGLVLVIGALAFYLVTYFNARAEAQKATKKVEVVATSQDKADDRVAALEAYVAADALRDACVEKQLRDALSRGTGHVIAALPDGATLWVEQNQPKAVPRTLWAKPTWFTIESCPAAPAPPKVAKP